MSFIAKNPLTIPEIKYTPSTPSGTRGLFVKEDGWYEVDSNNKVTKIATMDDIDYVNKRFEDLDVDVDLSNYVQKEEGYGLSGTRDVYAIENERTEEDEGYIDLYIENQYGEETAVELYGRDSIDAMLNKKRNAKNIQLWQPTGEDGIFELNLTDDCELYANTPISLLAIRANYLPLGAETYLNFTTSQNMKIEDYANVHWNGDNCNMDGEFIPQSNTAYEVLLKSTTIGIIARVKFCMSEDEQNTAIIDGSNGLDEFFEPGLYTVSGLKLDSIGTIYNSKLEVVDISHRNLQCGMASLKVSPYETLELDTGSTGKRGSMQELTLNYWYDDENGEYVEGSCVLVRMLDSDSHDGSFMYYGWHIVADTLGMGGSVDVDLSEYYTSDDVDTLLRSKADVSYAQTIEAIAKGRATGYVFDTYEDMHEWLSEEENRKILKLGDNLYIRALDVPDYWWDGSVPQPLETQKVDLSEYVEKEDGKGLSRIVDIDIGESNIDDFPSVIEIRRYDDCMISQIFDVYSASQIDKKFESHNDGIVTLKKNISFTVGDNIVTSDTPVILSDGWTKGSSGEYIHSSANKLTNPLEVQIEADDGAIYYVEWDLDFDKATSQSSASVAIGDSYSQDTYFGKNHIEMIVKCEGGGSLYITPLDSFNGSIANISCKPLTDGDGLVITQEFNGIYMDNVNADNYGRWNVILSDNAMLDTVNSTRSIAIGHSALNGCKGGNRNIAIGTFSMSKMSGGERNISIGSDAMLEVKAAKDNVVIGFGAMYYGGQDTIENTVIGAHAMQGSSGANPKDNTVIGFQAGYYNTSTQNTFVGKTAGYHNTSGYNNVGVGASSLSGNKTGYNNTCVGVSATVTDNVHDALSIGKGAKATKHNQAVIGSQYIVDTNGKTSGIKETVLYGDLIVYGTDKVARNVATENYVDAKIAEIPTGGGGSGGDIDLSEYVKKETGRGLSSIKNLHTSVIASDAEPNYTELYYEDQEGNPSIAEFYDKYQMKDNYYTKAEVDADLEALTDEVLNITYDMPLKQDVVNVEYKVDEPEIYYNFGYTHNTDTRLEDADTTSISFVFNDKVYVDDYISSLSFDSGETPTRIDYTDSGILNWVGTDCSDNNGYSIFKPEANKHYDIVFYFNGRQFIGLVNGFVPSLGNVVV